MKQFKKKRTKLPRKGAVLRMIRKHRLLGGGVQVHRYERELRMGRDIPEIIRQSTLARMHPQDRTKILYYPDLKNFFMSLEPNRTLPVEKFFALFKGMVDEQVIADAVDALTNYRLEIVREEEDFVRIYDDGNVHSCMSGPEHAEKVKCWVHPENHISLCALYAPGGSRVIARTLLNTQDMYYIRIFGTDGNSSMLATKLKELGYHRLSGKPSPFKMYAYCYSHRYDPGMVRIPYFDWKGYEIEQHRNTFNPETHRLEMTIS